MMIAVCPRCGEPVQLPAVSGDTTVACPLCQSEYRLDEVLSKLPPTLRAVEPPSPTETPTVVMGTDTSPGNETPTVVMNPTETSQDKFVDEPPTVSFIEKPPLAGSLDTDTDPVWDLHLTADEPSAVENETVEQPPVLTSEDTDPTPESFDFDAGSTPAHALIDHGLSSSVALRTAPRRRNFAVEFIKIALGGIAGLAIAQAILWWLPGGWRKDPLGLAPRLPSQLAFLAPADLRGQTDMGGERSAASTTQGSGAHRQNGADLQAAFEAAQADSRAASMLPAQRDGTNTFGSTTPSVDGPSATGQPSDGPADDSVDGLLGMRQAPSFSSLEIADSLVSVEKAVEDWVGGSVTDQEDRIQLARRLFEAFYQFAWKATFPDATADKSVALRARVDGVLRMISNGPGNVDLVGTAAASWLAAENRSTSGILLSGTVQSIDAQGAYYATTLRLSGKKERAVTIVNPRDPAADAQHSYQVGDKIVLLGAIAVDPPLDIVGYQGSAATVVWGGPRLVVPSAATGGSFF